MRSDTNANEGYRGRRCFRFSPSWHGDEFYIHIAPNAARRFPWLKRDVNGDGNSRMLSVVQVVPVVHVVDIDIVRPVPDGRPGFWARINHIEPEASELETRRTFDHHNWDVMDAKPMSTAKISTKTIWWNAVSMVSPALVPGAVFMLPIVSTLSLPDVLSYIV